MVPVIQKIDIIELGAKKEIRRDVKAWRALVGIWKGKKLTDPVVWQRKIRREASR